MVGYFYFVRWRLNSERNGTIRRAMYANRYSSAYGMVGDSALIMGNE